MKGLFAFLVLISISLNAQKSTIVIKTSVDRFKIFVDDYSQSSTTYGNYFIYSGEFPKNKVLKIDLLKSTKDLFIPFEKITKNKTYFEIKKNKKDSLYIEEVSPFVTNDVPFIAVYRTKPPQIVLDSSKIAKSCKLSDVEVVNFGKNFNYLKNEKSKITYITTFIAEKCVTINQAKVMLAPISNDEDRLMVSKMLYDHCSEINYFDNLSALFTKKEVAEKFASWLRTKK